jgi:GTP-binding protein
MNIYTPIIHETIPINTEKKLLLQKNFLKTPRVVLVGRPNVGKSAVFNRLLGKKIALVYDKEGVTRDWKEARGVTHQGQEYMLVDTAGLLSKVPHDDKLTQAMIQGTYDELFRAQVILWIFDGKTGMTRDDLWIRDLLRQHQPRVHVIINKSERPQDDLWREMISWGYGTPLMISALHGQGIADLESILETDVSMHYKRWIEKQESSETIKNDSNDKVHPLFDEDQCISFSDDHQTDFQKKDIKLNTIQEKNTPLKIVFLGRPNVGKSSLINRILGYNRTIINDQAGTTRDAISIPFMWHDHSCVLIDTAGIRRNASIKDRLEILSVEESSWAMELAHVVFLVLDATQALEKQDFVLAQRIWDEGRALVVVVNKWDLIPPENRTSWKKAYEALACTPFLKYAPRILCSALKDRSLESLWYACKRVFSSWNERVATGPLNRWIHDLLEKHPIIKDGKPIRIKYMTQIKSRPPTFVLHGNRLNLLSPDHERFLIKRMYAEGTLCGTPIRFEVKISENPYHEKKNEHKKIIQ